MRVEYFGLLLQTKVVFILDKILITHRVGLRYYIPDWLFIKQYLHGGLQERASTNTIGEYDVQNLQHT